MTQQELTDNLMKKAWREGYALGYARACDDATDWKYHLEGFSKTAYRKEAEEEEEWNASETKAVMARARDKGHMDNKIESIILDYCEGIQHLEFNKCEMPDMIREIKEAIFRGR